MSASEIDAVVPGNTTTGTIRVTTPTGSAISPSFTVDAAQAPIMTSFTPMVLSAGKVVSLTGTHFVGASLVQFNGTNAASFTVTSDREIQATAPSGLTAGTISVTTPGGTATSSSPYTVSTSVQVLMNTGFEQTSPVIWQGDIGVIQGASTSTAGVVPLGGTLFAWLGGYGSDPNAPPDHSDQITQDLYIPGSAQAATATFYMKILTDETGGSIKDSVIVEALNTSGTHLDTLLTKTNLDAADYRPYSVDLLPYKGQILRLSFKSQEDVQNATSFLLDEVVANIVAPTADLKPIISSFSPTSGIAGEVTVQLSGMNFFGLTGVTVGGVNAGYTLTDGMSLSVAIPPNAAPGNAPIAITNAQGTGTSTTNFSVTYGLPVVTGMNPTQGPVGTPVFITGDYLGYPGTTLTLNGQSIQPTSLSATQIAFTVPAGATTGNLVISTPGGTVTRTFMVNTASTTLDLHVENVQLTQSTQTFNNGVPIVAGKDGLIRVFVLANQTNTAAPSVKITIMDNNGVAVPGYPKVVAPVGSSVPTSLNESSLTSSWNLVVPGTDLATTGPNGVYLIGAEVDPAGTIPEADKSNNAQVRSFSGIAVPSFRTTIFPVVLSSGTGDITEANKGAWIARLSRMYPVAAVDVQVGTTFTPSISTLDSDSTQWSKLLNELATKHQAEGASDRYYYGALNISYGSGIAGMGYVPSNPSSAFYYRTAIGWDKTGYQDGGNFPEVFAHETGHNMGRHHSPCGSAASPDPDYPYAGGLIGAWGYDTSVGQLKSPATYKDIMGYCSPNWVSDYVYRKILDFRGGTGSFLTVGAEGAPLPKGQAGQAMAKECLIVRGIVHGDGKVELLPSFRTQATPSAVPGAGDYSLECVNQNGIAVFTTTVELMDLGCWPKGRERHFVMALPIGATILDSLAGLNVLKDGKIMASLRATSGVAVPPDLQRLPDGRVQLTWDVSTHPAALVRDADSGEVIAILSGGRQTFATRAKRFDLALSNGVAGRTHRLQILE